MIYRFRLIATLALLATLVCTGCYTLNGISISSETETYYVEQFTVDAVDAPAEIGQIFSELLKDKINSDTRLTLAETDPNVEFSGGITSFTVTPEAPNANDRSDLSRLTVSISVDYVDRLTPANSFRQTFTDYELFDANLDLLAVQSDLLEIIYDRISENAFNKAFSNW